MPKARPEAETPSRPLSTTAGRNHHKQPGFSHAALAGGVNSSKMLPGSGASALNPVSSQERNGSQGRQMCLSIFPCLILSVSHCMFPSVFQIHSSAQTICCRRCVLSPQIFCIFTQAPGPESQAIPRCPQLHPASSPNTTWNQGRTLHHITSAAPAPEDGHSHGRCTMGVSPEGPRAPRSGTEPRHCLERHALEAADSCGATAQLSELPHQPRRLCPWTCFVERPALKPGPFKVSLHIIIFILHERFPPRPAPGSLGLCAQPIKRGHPSSSKAAAVQHAMPRKAHIVPKHQQLLLRAAPCVVSPQQALDSATTQRGMLQFSRGPRDTNRISS